jgi:type I restriction enzyme S subunit
MSEGPYKLPAGWRWVRLGEVVTYVNGVWGKRYSGGVPVLRSTNFTDEGQLNFSEVARIHLSQKQVQKAVLKDGDILLERSGGGPTKPVGRVCIFTQPKGGQAFCFGNFVTVLRPTTQELNNRYLFHFLRWFHLSGQTERLQTQTTNIRNLRFKEYLGSVIPLPPLAEQRHIVARIEELMDRVREAKRLRQQAKEDADRLMQATLAEVFPRPGAELPEGWRWVRLGEVGEREATTIRPADFPDREFRYLGMEHVSPGQWEEPQPAEVRGAQIKSSVIVFRPGVVLYGKLRPYLNKVVVPSFDGVASTEFVPIATKNEIWAQYLGGYLRSPAFVAYASQNTTGARQPRTRLDALWNALIPLPPLSEQRRIVAHLEVVQEKVRALKATQAETEEELKRLEQSILDKAFRGEL